VFLKKHSNIFSWTPHREIRIMGDVIPNTDIVTLLNVTVSAHANIKTIPGMSAFVNVLLLLNTPPTLVINKYIKKILKTKVFYET
jgi:hypothetical protein